MGRNQSLNLIDLIGSFFLHLSSLWKRLVTTKSGLFDSMRNPGWKLVNPRRRCISRTDYSSTVVIPVLSARWACGTCSICLGLRPEGPIGRDSDLFPLPWSSSDRPGSPNPFPLDCALPGQPVKPQRLERFRLRESAVSGPATQRLFRRRRQTLPGETSHPGPAGNSLLQRPFAGLAVLFMGIPAGATNPCHPW